MKLLIFLNNDIHSATALNLISDKLRSCEVKIILSRKVGNAVDLDDRLLAMKNLEQDEMKQAFVKINNIYPDFFGDYHFYNIKQIAEILNATIFHYRDVNDDTALKDFENFGPDLVISIRYGQIFHERFIAIPRFGVINLHSGILPDYRGILASFWAILNGEKEIGMTLHFIDDRKIDSGSIIATTKMKIDWQNSLLVNVNLLYRDGAKILLNAIEQVISNKRIISTTQTNLTKDSYFSYPKSEDIDKFLKIMPLF